MAAILPDEDIESGGYIIISMLLTPLEARHDVVSSGQSQLSPV